MSGIVFFGTRELAQIRDFYVNEVGMLTWLEQGDVAILSHGNLKIGFHSKDKSDLDALITFFYAGRDGVDAMHARFASIADAPPRLNEKYRIYHFFARDPEGRRIEFQSFEHDLEPFLDGGELLVTRRSVRQFQDRPVDDRVLGAVLESCRLAPSARNSQPVEFVIVRDHATLGRLAALRPESSDPIARAPMAVAIVSDPAASPLPIDDGCIAAYHLLLAAWSYGLGTCWIGGLNRDDAKAILGIPKERYLVTVTPLGWPAERPAARPRRDVRVREL